MPAVVRRLRDRIRSDEEDGVPPARDLLVDLHLLVVRVVEHLRCLVPRVEGLEEGLDVLPVPEEDVGKSRAEREVGRHESERVGCGEECGLNCSPLSMCLTNGSSL